MKNLKKNYITATQIVSMGKNAHKILSQSHELPEVLGYSNRYSNENGDSTIWLAWNKVRVQTWKGNIWKVAWILSCKGNICLISKNCLLYSEVYGPKDLKTES